jgi:predicted AAA+ superfamily ATPase
LFPFPENHFTAKSFLINIEISVDITEFSRYYFFMIRREKELQTIYELLRKHPIVGIVGARQVGKTTLARMILSKKKVSYTYYDLENPEDFSQLSDPMLVLKELKGLVVIDEIQRYPDLFPVLRVLSDRLRRPARFLILGSASPELLRQSAESLAGRIFYHELSGFSLDEVGIPNHKKLWLRGGFPRSYLARSHDDSFDWRRGFIRNFLERDLPQLGINIRSTTLHRFWTMLAHYHGQTWNASEFARSFGVADTTVRNYLDLLSSALVVRQFPPWHENIKKRQVKAPKVYLKDSGILHTLLNLRSLKDLEGHPKIGASWEGFVLEQVIRRLEASTEECFFWATHSGAELDLLIVRGRKRLGFEIKRTSSPKITPSMRMALQDLSLQRLDIIHAGEESFRMHKKIRAVSILNLLTDLHPLS